MLHTVLERTREAFILDLFHHAYSDFTRVLYLHLLDFRKFENFKFGAKFDTDHVNVTNLKNQYLPGFGEFIPFKVVVQSSSDCEAVSEFKFSGPSGHRQSELAPRLNKDNLNACSSLRASS